MANLGAKGRPSGFKSGQSRYVATVTAITEERPNRWLIDTTGSLSGIVSINSVPIGGVLVRLHIRNANDVAPINRLETQPDGSYTFVGLDKTDKYYIVILDPTNDAPYNYSVVKDHLTAG